MPQPSFACRDSMTSAAPFEEPSEARENKCTRDVHHGSVIRVGTLTQGGTVASRRHRHPQQNNPLHENSEHYLYIIKEYGKTTTPEDCRCFDF